MKDLTIAPGPGIPDGAVIAAADLTERFAKSSGPGGQGVNPTDSKVQLSIDIAESASLTDAQRRRILRNLEHRLDGSVLTVSTSTQRSQVRNRAEARERMAALLREALAPPPSPAAQNEADEGLGTAPSRSKEAALGAESDEATAPNSLGAAYAEAAWTG